MEEATCGRDQIKDREYPLSRLGIPDGDNYEKEKVYSNDGDGNGYGEALGIPTDSYPSGWMMRVILLGACRLAGWNWSDPCPREK